MKFTPGSSKQKFLFVLMQFEIESNLLVSQIQNSLVGLEAN